MFAPGENIKASKRDYTVALDFLSSADKVVDTDSFVSSSTVINQKKYYFINSFASTQLNNPIGFWQTILLNDIFDLSKTFRFKFIINNEVFLISSDPEMGLIIYNNINLVDIDDFEEVEIDFNNLNQFTIIKTKQQAKESRKRANKKIIIKHLFVYLFFIILSTVYYFYEKSNFDKKQKILNDIKSEVLGLRAQINNKHSKLAAIRTKSQSAQINTLARLEAYSLIVDAQVDLTSPVAEITVDIANADLAKSILLKSGVINLKTNQIFSKNIATINYKIKAQKDER